LTSDVDPRRNAISIRGQALDSVARGFRGARERAHAPLSSSSPWSGRMSREFPPARLPPLAFAPTAFKSRFPMRNPSSCPSHDGQKPLRPSPAANVKRGMNAGLWGETQRCVCVIGRRQGCHTPHGAVIAKGKRQAAAVDSRASLSIAAKAAELMETRAVAVRIHISEINFQPPHTKRAMIRRTKRLAVNSSRPGCAVGGKSKSS
jgi:hypothetical protein